MRLLISLILLFSFSPYVGALTSLDRAEFSFPNSLQDSNPGFESGTVKWSGSGGTFTINSTAADQFVAGSKQFAVWDSDGAAQERCSSLVKVPESGNCAVSLTYKVPSGTATHKIVAKDGSKDLSVEDVFSSTAAWRHDVEFPCASAASNQARVCLRSVASNEPAIQLDQGYAGEARQVSKCGVDTPWVSYTPVITGLGTGSATITGMWRGVGDSIEASFLMTMTSNGSGSDAVEISIPSQFTMNASKFLSNGGPRGAAFSQAATILTCGANSTSGKIVLATNAGAATGSALVNTNIVRCSVTIPVNERTASQCVTPADSLDFIGAIFYVGSSTCPVGSLDADGTAISRSTYAALFAKYGTTFGVGDGSTTFNKPDLRGIFVRGVGSQTISSITYTGTLGAKQGDQFQHHDHNRYTRSIPIGANASIILDQGNDSSFNTGTRPGPGTYSANGGGTPRAGSETRPANISLRPCIANGKIQTTILANSVWTGATQMRIETVTIQNNGSACSTLGNLSSNWVGVYTRNGAGRCQFTMPSGVWSSTPTCQCTVQSTNAVSSCSVDSNITLSSTLMAFHSSVGGSAADSTMRVMCMEPR